MWAKKIIHTTTVSRVCRLRQASGTHISLTHTFPVAISRYAHKSADSVAHIFYVAFVTVILRLSKQSHILNVSLYVIIISYLQDISLINYEKQIKHADLKLLMIFFSW